MSNPSGINFEIIKQAIGGRHLEQLRNFKLVVDPLENYPINSTYDDLVNWTNASKTQMGAAMANRVFGGPIGSQIDFNNAFMAFMESAAMYLRDTSKVVEAVEAYRSGGDKADAVRLLISSTSQISDLADLWGMQFVQICDFVTRHPDGQRYLVGPFCGAFIPKNFSGNSPYIGIAFKGTSVTAEVINDLLAMTTVYASGRLWEAQVATGFYFPLFSTYDQPPLSAPSSMPFVMIQQAVQDISTKATTTAITHVTGHSLGGAYSSLCYGQLCIAGFGTVNAALGDLYTFGSPRVGRGDLARPFKAAVANGSSWRIMNNKDYVPKVPAPPPWPISRDPFIHIDAAYKIYPDQKPAAQPSEIGTNPTWSFPTAISPHYTTEYFKSLTYATTSNVLSNNIVPVKSATYPLAISTFSSDNVQTMDLDANVVPEISFEQIDSQGLTVGTIKYSSFVGEITVVGIAGLYGELNSTSFRYKQGQSWKTLYTKQNQCIFKKIADDTLGISFIVDGAEVAVAQGTQPNNSIGDVTKLTRGTCTWVFCEDVNITDTEKRIVADANDIFDLVQ